METPDVQANLGPEDWDQFVGQEKLKERLLVHINAAFQQVRPLDHTLLAGPPGFGKSTLARIIAGRLHDALTIMVMPMSRRALIHDLAMFGGGVLFLDEIHALGKRDQELLLPVLDESVVIDERGRRFQIPFLSVVAATTERDKLISPLLDRFAIKPDFVAYTDVELGEIVRLMGSQAQVEMSEQMAIDLGRASGGVPRQARQFVLAARDLAVTLERPATAEEILDLCVVDADGLTALHLQYLKILADQRGTAGEKTLQLLLQLPSAGVRDLERLLLSRHLVDYSPSGRQLTPQGLDKAHGRATRTYTRQT